MGQERPTTSVDFSAKGRPMADTDLAANMMDQVIGTRGVREPVKSMLERAYSALSKQNKAWTRRRVRAVFNKEAQRIDYREIKEMEAVIEARKRHAAFKEETARLATMAIVRTSPHDGDVAAR
jgi:hypothetical protein